MSYISAGSVMGRGARSSVVFPGTTPATEGTFEPQVLALSPAVYLKLADTADSSGNGRDATLGGTGGAFVNAITPNVGAGNNAFDTQGTAFLTVAHAAADIALNFPSNWSSSQTTDGTRFIADATICCDFNPQTLPSGSNRAVIFAKSANQTPGVPASYAESTPISATRGDTVNGGSFEAYFDTNGAVHVEVRSFRGRLARVRTPNGAVTTGQRYHLTVQLSYDGVTAWLNGAKFEDGYANLLHVYGLAADIRGVTFRNNYAWTLGKAAWGGQADVILDEFAVFLRAPSATISQSNVNTLAQVGSTPTALAHPIWGALTVNRSFYASIQDAIDDVSASGGGTVLFNAGTHSGDIVLKSNVRLKPNSGTVTFTGLVSTAAPSIAVLTTSDNLTEGDNTLSVTNTRSVGDVVKIRGVDGATESPMRQDRRYNSTSESNDPRIADTQQFLITAATGSALTFEGSGSCFPFSAANRETIQAYTPTSNIALENITVNRAAGCIILQYCVGVRLWNVNATANVVSSAAVRGGPNSMYVQIRGGTIDNDNTGNCSALDLVFQCGQDNITKGTTVHCNSHGVDSGGNTNSGASLRMEAHNFTQAEFSGESRRAKIGGHGVAADTIFWNTETHFGGYGGGGWKIDCRWGLFGNGGNGGSIIPNDGLGDSTLRDLHCLATNGRWFHAEEGAVGVDNNHFENLTMSGTPLSTHTSMNYGNGADVNTYHNVDSSDASWQAV